MVLNGLCIIPEGSKKKGIGSDFKSEIYNVSDIRGLQDYLTYAKFYNLGVLYLSTKYGIVYADDIVTQSPVYLYKLKTDYLKLWSKIISEQIFRECLKHYVSVVHLMVRNRWTFNILIKELKMKGVMVETPLLSDRGKQLWKIVIKK